MTSKMVGSVLTLVILLFSVVGGAAQTYTQMQWGMNKGVTPYAFGANINGTWRDLGTVSATGVWSIPSSNLSFTQTGAGAVAQTVDAKLKQAVNVKDFGAKCDGSTDDAAAFQTAVNAVKAAGGALSIPNGTCKIGSEISVTSGTVYFVGAGADATTILYSGTNTNVFAFNGTAFDGGVEKLRILAAGTPTAGCGVLQSNGVGAVKVESVRVEGLYHAVCMSNAGYDGVLSVINSNMANIIGDTYLINGGSQFFLSNTVAFQSSPNPICLHIVAGGAFYIQNSTCQASTIGVKINPTAGLAALSGFFTNFEIDASTDTGFVLDSTGGGTITNFRITNVRSGFNVNHGFLIDGANTQNITFTNCQAERNGKLGFWQNNGKHIQISSSQFVANSALTTGNSGLAITGGDDIQVTNLVATATFVGPGGSSNQEYGIRIYNTFTGALQIVGGNFDGNVSGTILNQSTSPSSVVGKNTWPDVQTFSSGVVSAGTKPTATGAGGTCAAGTVTGGALVGTVALTGNCASTNTLALTGMPAATTGYVCDATDRTAKAVTLVETTTTTTSATFEFTASSNSGNVIQFKCLGY